MKKLITLITILLILNGCISNRDIDSISASQLIAQSEVSNPKALFFEANSNSPYKLDIDGFSSPDEFTIRRGLPNFFRRCASGEDVKIAYMGGSITNADNQYRKQSANYIASMFPDIKVAGINAAWGSTGSDVGSCLTQEYVTAFNPDLVFIEYAVNGSNANGIEGIIRKLIEFNPEIDICMIYTLYRNQCQEYAKGGMPANIAKLDRIAEHYNLPSIHMGYWAGILEHEGKLIWAADEDYDGDEIIFSNDGVHPCEAGGNLYASAIARAFNAMKGNRAEVDMKLIEPLSSTHMAAAQSLDLAEFNLETKGWVKSECKMGNPRYEECRMIYNNLYTADENSEPIEFKFEGDMLGIMDVGSQDNGAIDIVIDGEKYVALEYNQGYKVMKHKYVDVSDPTPSSVRFNTKCLNEAFTQKSLIAIPLNEYREHKVTISFNTNKLDKASIIAVTEEEYKAMVAESPKFTDQKFHLGRILINGEIVK
ncbi:MAG: SGNH/GDSL hydrolase family protein [Rikenellaceae bacterium]